MNNKLFSEKLKNIHDDMMKCYQDSKKYSPTITGFEREIFQNELLSKILPNTYRIGSGSITDYKGRETGQIDLVIELPFSLSFPISSGQNRLYLANTVGCAFEIKSNLYNQWDEAMDKIKEIKALHRTKSEEREMVMLTDVQIPTFIVSYTGYIDKETIYEKLKTVDRRDWPNGIFIIDSGLFLGLYGGDGVLETKSKSGSVLGFISYLYQVLHTYRNSNIDLYDYKDLL